MYGSTATLQLGNLTTGGAEAVVLLPVLTDSSALMGRQA